MNRKYLKVKLYVDSVRKKGREGRNKKRIRFISRNVRGEQMKQQKIFKNSEKMDRKKIKEKKKYFRRRIRKQRRYRK